MLTFVIPGLSQLEAAFQKAGSQLPGEFKRAMNLSTALVRDSAKRNLVNNRSVITNQLRTSIVVTESTQTRGVITVNAPYGKFVEYGTRPHVIQAVNKKVLANKKAGIIFGKIVHHPGSRAKPFLDPAVTQNKEKIMEYFRQAMAAVFKTIGGNY